MYFPIFIVTCVTTIIITFVLVNVYCFEIVLFLVIIPNLICTQSDEQNDDKSDALTGARGCQWN